MKFGDIIQWIVTNKELILTMAGLLTGLVGFYASMKSKINILDLNNKKYNSETVSLLKTISERENIKPMIENLMVENEDMKDKVVMLSELLLTAYKNSTLDGEVKSEIENIVGNIKYSKDKIEELHDLKEENLNLKKHIEEVTNKKPVVVTDKTQARKKNNKVRL